MKSQKSIESNFIYSSMLKGLNIIFPLITFPYVARILSPEGIGKVDFSLSIIQYFILIAQVGIPTYAIRECAKVRDSEESLTKTVQEILVINLVMVIISYLLFSIVILNVNQLASYRYVLLVGSLNILSTSIGIEWFYQAIEEYKYITIRSMFVKLISLIAIFLFVKEENDFIIYALIIVLSTSIGYLYNFIHVYNYIDLFKKFKGYNFKKHIKPIIILFAMSLSISMYVSLDKIMLGFISGDTAVGLYTAANKMVKLVLSLVTSLGLVLLPRMSYYIENDEEIQVKRLIRKSLDFTFMIAVPSFIGIIMLAKPIILLFAGEEYLNAIPTIRIISPIILAIGLSNLIGIQVLVSYGKERITFFSTLIGAVVNFTLNLLLIPLLQHNGAAIATLVAEISVVIFQLLYSYEYIKGNVSWKSIASYFFGGILIIFITTTINYLTSNLIIFSIVSIALSVISYFSFLYFIKNEMITLISNSIISKIKK